MPDDDELTTLYSGQRPTPVDREPRPPAGLDRAQPDWHQRPPPDDRDRALCAAVEAIGPVTPHVLARHPGGDAFADVAALEARAKALVDRGHLRRRTAVDVTGSRVTEYDRDPR